MIALLFTTSLLAQTHNSPVPRKPTTYAFRVALNSPSQGVVTETSRVELVSRAGIVTQGSITSGSTTSSFWLTQGGKRRKMSAAELESRTLSIRPGDILESRHVTTFSGPETIEFQIPLLALEGDLLDLELLAAPQVPVAASVRRRALEPTRQKGKQLFRYKGPFDSLLALLPASPQPGFQPSISYPAPEALPFLLVSTARSWDEVLPPVDVTAALPDAVFTRLTEGEPLGPLNTAIRGVDTHFKVGQKPSGKRLEALTPGDVISSWERISLIGAVARRLGSKVRVGFFTSQRLFESDPSVPQRAGATDAVFAVESSDGGTTWLLPKEVARDAASNNVRGRLVFFGAGQPPQTIPVENQVFLAARTEVDLTAEGTTRPVTQSITLSRESANANFDSGSGVMWMFEQLHGNARTGLSGTATGFQFSSPNSKAARRGKDEGEALLGWHGLVTTVVDGDWFPGLSTTVDRFVTKNFVLEGETIVRLPPGWAHDATAFDVSVPGLSCWQRVEQRGSTVVVTRRFGVETRVVPAKEVGQAQRTFEHCARLPGVLQVRRATAADGGLSPRP